MNLIDDVAQLRNVQHENFALISTIVTDRQRKLTLLIQDHN